MLNYLNQYAMKNIFLLLVFSVSLLISCDTKKDNSDSLQEDTNISKITKPNAPNFKGAQRILFVGNSHTEYFASFPQIVQALCIENGKNVEVLTLIEMGVGINKILTANKSKADKMFKQTDADGNYLDFIIIQEATPIAIQYEDQFLNNSKSILDLAMLNSPDVATYIYELMAPFDYGTSDFKNYQLLLTENVINVAKALPNTGVLNFATVLNFAYQNKGGYASRKKNKDMLRHIDSSRHMLNDAVFLNSIVLYQYIYGETPKIPQQLPLSTGTDDKDQIKLMDVNKGVSNPSALLKIAKNFL